MLKTQPYPVLFWGKSLIVSCYLNFLSVKWGTAEERTGLPLLSLKVLCPSALEPGVIQVQPVWRSEG